MSLNTFVSILQLVVSPLFTLVLTVLSIVIAISVVRFLKAQRRLAVARYKIAMAELAAVQAKKPDAAEAAVVETDAAGAAVAKADAAGAAVTDEAHTADAASAEATVAEAHTADAASAE